MGLRYEIADMAPGPTRQAALIAYASQARAGVHLIADAKRPDDARRQVVAALRSEQRMLRGDRLPAVERERALAAVEDALVACVAPRGGRAGVTYDAIVCGALRRAGRGVPDRRPGAGDRPPAHRRGGDLGVGGPARLPREHGPWAVEQVHAEPRHPRGGAPRLRFFDFATFDYRRF